MLRILALTYCAILVFITGCQRSLIYYPAKLTEADSLARAGRAGLTPWLNAQGERIGWRQENAAARHRLVVFHGNAGSALDRTYYVDGFQEVNRGRDWEIYLFEYPGYGARSGSPGKPAFLQTGQEAIQDLLAKDARPVYVLGESVGSGTASALAGMMPEQVKGAFLVIPFKRLQDVAQAKFPFLPVGLILWEKYDNAAALANFHGPVAVVVAENDEIVGAEQGRKLHEAYAGPKHLVLLPGATHNDFPVGSNAPWFREVSEFVLQPRK